MATRAAFLLSIKKPTGDSSHSWYVSFSDIGAIDGTHVRVRVPNRDAPKYHGRKGYPTINVLVACTFDLKFTYVLSGWEGTTSDSRIVKDALTRDDKLIIPNGKYYLVDGGLPHRSTLIAPYRGVDRDKELKDEVIDEMLAASHDEEPHGPRDMDDRGEQIRNSIANDMWTTTKKESFSWNEQMDAAFIEAILKEQNAGNRPNETFSPHAYNNMVKVLRVAMSGYAWNSSTRLIEAEDDVWEALNKDKPDVYKLKTKQVNCYDEMYALRVKYRATGSCSFTAKEKKNQQNNDQQAETVEEINHLFENNVINLDNIGTSNDIHVTSPTPQSDGKLPTKSKSKKRKVVKEDTSQDKIANSLDNIVHALDRNSKVLENSRPHGYTEGQIYEELTCMGLERKDIHTAYAYLLEHPVKTRGLFGCPVEHILFYLKAIMGLGDSKDSDTRG
ncbi:Myb/SANT-like domain-containing protein [Tanacetum coccineum]